MQQIKVPANLSLRRVRSRPGDYGQSMSDGLAASLHLDGFRKTLAVVSTPL